MNHANANALLQYVEERITNDNLPVVVSTRVSGNGAHMLTVLCIDNNNVQVFDTGGRNRPMRRTRQALTQRLAPGLGTLVINPR